MTTTLTTKNKVGFVDESISQPPLGDLPMGVWTHCNHDFQLVSVCECGATWSWIDYQEREYEKCQCTINNGYSFLDSMLFGDPNVPITASTNLHPNPNVKDQFAHIVVFKGIPLTNVTSFMDILLVTSPNQKSLNPRHKSFR
ncbi:hypothetical protein AAG906_001664 [Vitis piasezkii]